MLNKKNIVTLSLIIIALTNIIYAFSTGITGRTLKNQNDPGCTCHNPLPSSIVMVLINGPDQLAPGETSQYSVLISGGPLQRAGTNIAASSGILEPIGNDLQKIGEELTHSSPKTPANNTVTFEFNYTAPDQEGEITLYANGNSVNFNGNNGGDQWNYAPNKSVNVSMSTNVNDEKNIVDKYVLSQNYPNPFNPSTKITFTMPEAGNVKLIIFNSLGNEVARLVDEYKIKGEYTYTFNSENLSGRQGLASGVYFYKLISGSFIETKKMLLLK